MNYQAMKIQQAINAANAKLASLASRARTGATALARRWAPAVPAKVWLAAAALVFAGLWLQEHDARVRRAVELKRAEQQGAAEMAALESQAAAAIRQANQRNARAIAELEAERSKLARRSQKLAAQLQSLQSRQQERAREIATLPPAKLTKQLAQRLGPSSVVHNPAKSTPARGELTLSEQGQRQVASALAERDSCRGQNRLQAQQVSNCREQLRADAAEIRKQADSMAQLNRALDAKDRIFKQREVQFKARLKAARGTWHSRLFRAVKFVAVGMAIGAAVR